MGLLVAVWALAIPAQAIACSPVRGYRVPTNIELLDRADLVVLASVKSGPDSYEDSLKDGHFEASVVLEPRIVLKGETPPELLVEGMLKDRDGQPYLAIPTRLDQPHPSSLWGACIRQAYAKGTLVVAMFDRTAEGYRQVGDAFARAIEDVEGPDALWVRAAQLYLRLLSEPDPITRRLGFQRERDQLLRLKDDADAQSIAADIAAYLKATSPK